MCGWLEFLTEKDVNFSSITVHDLYVFTDDRPYTVKY
jgi:hypothetical protein